MAGKDLTLLFCKRRVERSIESLVLLTWTVRRGGEGGREVRGLDDNWVVRVGGEPEGAVGGEGGAAHSLEGDDVEAVRRGLEVDEVEGAGEGERRRVLVEDVERRRSLARTGVHGREERLQGLVTRTRSPVPGEGGNWSRSLGLGHDRHPSHHLVHCVERALLLTLPLHQLLNVHLLLHNILRHFLTPGPRLGHFVLVHNVPMYRSQEQPAEFVLKAKADLFNKSSLNKHEI